mmetsp:Transcript_60229/g.140773  ORF Transcript_60229/g.140773 Transcript_60229/m.140773 type:complete len:266 (+) Transcript_60229:179-976(+)
MLRPASAPFHRSNSVALPKRSVARRPFGLVRAATAPVPDSHFEVPFAKELLGSEDLLVPTQEPSPLSPVSAAVQRHRAEPLAVVRHVPLSRPASAGDLRVSSKEASASRPMLTRARTTEMDTPTEKVDVRLRRLSHEECEQRRARAVSFFKESSAINRISRCSEASKALEAARHRRARAKEPEVEESEAERAQPENVEPPRPRPRRSFAEQFGYGVILKTQPVQRQAQVLPEAPKPKMTGAFIGLQAGDTDLLQRLARRRASLGA